MRIVTTFSFSLFPVALFAFLTTLLPSTPVAARQVVFRSADDGSMAAMAIPGGMLIVVGESEAHIRRFMAGEDRSGERIDIKEGDLVIYLNGTRIESASQLNQLYEEVAVGAEVKLGIQRGEDKMIRSFEKPEMQDTFTSVDDGGGRVMRFEFSGPGEGDGMTGLANPGMWPAGFLVGEKNGAVVIGQSIPLPDKAEALAIIEVGDVIASLNGAPITSVSQLNEAYDAIAVGDDVTAEVKKGQNVEKVMFKKPEPPRMRIQLQNN